jgi:hypothetical protein
VKAFQFPLERVLHWRRTQLELERAAMERLVQRRMELQEAVRALAARRMEADVSIAHAEGFPGRDVQTFSAYQARARREKAALMERGQILDRETAAQLAIAMEAQRRVKLLERLRGQRLREWTSATDAEQERFAAEAWLGRWPMLKAGDDECTAAMASRPRLDPPLP